MSSSQLTFTPSFFRGVGQPPTSMFGKSERLTAVFFRETVGVWWPPSIGDLGGQEKQSWLLKYGLKLKMMPWFGFGTQHTFAENDASGEVRQRWFAYRHGSWWSSPAGIDLTMILQILTYTDGNWLVVWNMNFIFPYIGNVILSTDEHIFQRGRSTTN